jgi:hypothetical protein
VNLGGADGEIEGARDLLVGLALHYQLQDVALTRTQEIWCWPLLISVRNHRTRAGPGQPVEGSVIGRIIQIIVGEPPDAKHQTMPAMSLGITCHVWSIAI